MILKFTLRNLIKRPFLNLIKIIGLSLALSGILIMSIFLKNELTYDSFHKKANRIYRYTTTSNVIFGGKHFARIYNASYIPQMTEFFPEIESYVRMAPIRDNIKYNNKFIVVNQAFECDSTFFDVFDDELLVGNPKNILNEPGTGVISESFAKKIFGDTNPIGQVLTLPTGQYSDTDYDFTIKGIMKDFPQNSHFHPEFITTPINKSIFNSWAWTYLLMSKNADPNHIISGFKDFYSFLTGEDGSELKIEPHLQKITDIHLYSHKLREIEANSNMSVIYTISIAALILLFIALTNYANLNMGMLDFSSKFLFVNNLFGSSNKTNLKYFLFEGIIISIISVTISGFIVDIVNNLIQKHFAISLFTGSLPLILTVIVIFIALSMLFSIMPLLKQGISNMKLFLHLKNKNNLKRKGISKSIIILQYTISIALIVAVFVIHRQTQYALKSSMGVDNNNLICLENVHSNVQRDFGVFKEELLKYESIESVSGMLEPPGGEANDRFRFNMEGYIADATNKEDSLIGIFPCDYSFARIFNLKFLSGKNFSSKNEENEGSGEYIINKAAMLRLHYKNPDEIIGKKFSLTSWNEKNKIPSGEIIGVVDDFHLSNIKKEVEPLVMFKRKDMWLLNFVISYKSGEQQKAISEIKSVWTKLFPEYLFQFKYVNSMYKNLYKTELLQTRLLSVFTFIALFICSMGLLGLSLLVTQRCTKEIGIRKVNGATITEIITMLNWSLIKWILLSVVIAIPLAFWTMHKWLENYAYKTALSWWIFVLAGLIAIVISLITVSIISWKAANNNPVKALRYE